MRLSREKWREKNQEMLDMYSTASMFSENVAGYVTQINYRLL